MPLGAGFYIDGKGSNHRSYKRLPTGAAAGQMANDRHGKGLNNAEFVKINMEDPEWSHLNFAPLKGAKRGAKKEAAQTRVFVRSPAAAAACSVVFLSFLCCFPLLCSCFPLLFWRAHPFTHAGLNHVSLHCTPCTPLGQPGT